MCFHDPAIKSEQLLFQKKNHVFQGGFEPAVFAGRACVDMVVSSLLFLL